MLVAPYFPPEVTGSSNFVADLALGLVEQGHEVCVVTAAVLAKSDSYHVVILPAKRWKPGNIAFDYSLPMVFSRANHRVLSELFTSFAPDVVSVHGQIFDITIMAAIMAHRRGIPTTMTVHSAIWHDKPLFNFILAIGDKAISRFFLRRNITSWIGVDDRTITHTQERYAPVCAPIPICIRSGAFVGGNEAAARQKYSITSDVVIASIGHVVPVRNRVALIEALPDVLKTFPAAQVVIVGRVADESFLVRARELGVDHCLLVIGAVPHADISDLLATATLEIHDLQGYGFGIASLEPIDAGVPVLSFVRENNLPGVNLADYSPESFLPDNEPHTLSEAIVRVLSDNEFRNIVMTGQKRLVDEVYSQDVVVKKYVAVFHNALHTLHR